MLPETHLPDNLLVPGKQQALVSPRQLFEMSFKYAHPHVDSYCG